MNSVEAIDTMTSEILVEIQLPVYCPITSWACIFEELPIVMRLTKTFMHPTLSKLPLAFRYKLHSGIQPSMISLSLVSLVVGTAVGTAVGGGVGSPTTTKLDTEHAVEQDPSSP